MSCNASLFTVFAGLKPVRSQKLVTRPGNTREYFQFRSGQIRRQIGEGHSHAERRARRQARTLLRGQVRTDDTPSIAQLAGQIIAQQFARS